MNDPTRFDLDDRQRAMLAEMGVRVWTPLASALGPALPVQVTVQSAPTEAAVTATAKYSAAPTVPASEGVSAPLSAVLSAPVSDSIAEAVSAQASPAAADRLVAPVKPGFVRPALAANSVATSAAHAAAHPAASAPSTDAAHPPLPEGLAEMDAAALQTAAANCQACGLCAQRQHSVFGTGSMQADWLVLGDAPSDAENALGQPFAGDAGRLLDNMLKAVGLNREGEGAQGAYLMHATQCATPDARNPTPEELRRCAAYVSRQVALVQPRVILVMGRFALQSLLHSTEPLGKMRGRVAQHQGIPVVVTYPPAYLLRNPADKGKAWADLCLALKVVQDSRQ
jgi:DNA polymerase